MNNTGEFQGKTHHFPVRVYYSDTDCGGIVYHSNYLNMAEHARSEFFRLLGGDQSKIKEEENLLFVVRSINIDYHKPAFLDDALVVKTTIEKKEVFSVIFRQEIYRDDVLVSKLMVKAASVSEDASRPVPMGAKWDSLLSDLVETT